MEEVHHPKIRQQVRDLLAPRVLGFSGVGAESPYHYGILVPEESQGLLQVRYVIQGVWRYLYADDQGLISVGNDLEDHHVCPMEARCLYASALGSVLDDHAHPPLRAVHLCHYHRLDHHVLSQPAETIILVGDIGLHYYHQVKAANLYRPYCLRNTGSLSVADVEGPKGYSPGARITLAQWQWCCVEAVLDMADWPGEANRHIGRVPQKYVPH